MPESNNRPAVWEMIKEAVDHSPDTVLAYAQIKDYIHQKYGDVNDATINAQIIVCTVNQPSRIYYPENQKPRQATARYDFLYSIGRGTVVRYDPVVHGMWEIAEDDQGRLHVVQHDVSDTIELTEVVESSVAAGESGSLAFPFESHLRDFIVKNIGAIPINGSRLQLFVDDRGVTGVEYRTGVGIIDILAVDEAGNPVVFELKLSRGEDKTLGQILRYMGWVQRNIAIDKKVRGVIVAQSFADELRYAVSITPQISLFQYEINFSITQADPID